MIAGEKLHPLGDALPQESAPASETRSAANGPLDRADSGSQSRMMSELAYAVGGGAALLIVALLLYLVAAWLGAGTAETVSGAGSELGAVAAYGEQFAGLFLAGALGTFIAREFVVKPR